jgi:hypothetical protein
MSDLAEAGALLDKWLIETVSTGRKNWTLSRMTYGGCRAGLFVGDHQWGGYDAHSWTIAVKDALRAFGQRAVAI